MKQTIKIIGLMLIPYISLGQSTAPSNLQTGNRFIGFTNNFPLQVRTNGITRAIFTTGNALNSVVGNTGDGLRIVNPTPNVNTGHLDMFTSNINGGNETHIVWGSSGYNISFV